MARSSKEDRLFAREPFRHYRRTYSLAEVRWGLVVLLVLVGTAVWVRWKGAHPDPSLSAAPPLASGSAAADPASADRGPIPEDIAAPGWREGEASQFDASNLYVKINGRADYFLSYGFERLYFVSLRHGEDEAGASVEIEMYDLRSPANALGAFGGEQKDGEPETTAGGLVYQSRNALFLAQGDYYIRAIGSEESEVVAAQLARLRGAFESGVAGGERPWSHQLLVDRLGVGSDEIDYERENGFSFGFASDLYIARLDDDTQLFVTVRASDEDAAAFAAQMIEGFASVGEAGDDGWVVDRYLSTFATAVAEGRFVLGVRGAPDRDRGVAELERLREGLAALPPEVRDGAEVAAPADSEPPPEPPMEEIVEE